MFSVSNCSSTDYPSLAAVNFFLFCVGATQVSRVMMYRQSLTDQPLSEQIQEVADDAKAKAKEVVNDPKAALSKAKSG